VSIHVALRHLSRYTYDQLIHLGPQLVRLRPAPHCKTRILSYSLQVHPAKHFINWQQDPQSNYLARLVFPDRTKDLRIEVELVAEMAVHNPFDFFLDETAQEVPFKYDVQLDEELAPYLKPCNTGPAFKQFMEQLKIDTDKTVDFLVELNRLVYTQTQYVIRLEPGVQTPDETLTKQSGSCRDSAWLLVQVLRHLGMAARFASGYLIQLSSDVKAINGPDGPEQDFTDLHAWCEVYLPGAGWVGLDPTSGLLAGEGHIPLACSPEPSSAAPITGLLDECEVAFEHTMQIQRIHESPRTSKPYSEEEWKAIEATGHDVDRLLKHMDVRLTMGGEPTFVANSDPGGAEWNVDALGPTKRQYGAELLKRMSQHYGAGGFFHFGQGKWYPGEQLPRWALSLYWRKDGQAIWHNPALLSQENGLGKANSQTAKQFTHALCAQLGIVHEHVQTGYEDVWFYLWKERRLPTNVAPLDARLQDPLERERLYKVFHQGLGSPVGYCLPLQHNNLFWETGPWFLRDEHLYLIPGDSPMGYRLPLDGLPWVAQMDRPYTVHADPFSPNSRVPLKYQSRSPATTTAKALGAASSNTPPALFESAKFIIRTALCVQARNGHLYIFMPPLNNTEHYLELLNAVEKTAERLNQPVVIEGYAPPRDSRLELLQMTPDPGVLEVNVQPSDSWSSLVQLTQTLYEEARQTGLSTEKFMLDGRHSGTGGGNHFVLGGQTPADSPFLRRPDLLGSLLRYWHNHPCLSYLFSGLFIGPTSQAPRIDEARTDQTHELELALHELDKQTRLYQGNPPPWLIDRILRNILIDSTGNTHRSEFCIDKLYSPDSPTGRLGLLELRGFEMPPHASMSLTQQLLLRSLIAKFWQTPYTQKLVQWGNRLHDQFMLPHFVREDMGDVVQDLKSAGLHFELDWLKPHFAFRFPKLGDLTCQGVHIELHSALEPWHVLGEEGAVGGTVRYVDSTLERIEIKVRNLIANRHQLCCNGVQIPLHPTGVEGEYVAGIRYRAWQAPHSLHPTIGVDSPLTVDLIDTWNARSLGGCQYHVAHPGGRNYEVFPINAFEAESRRLSRFFRMGHSQGLIHPIKPSARPEFPMTLDLRWR
jgi:uncharacterized protein (DUF2126 family)/transglutaminase-like putative cysteine protease